MQGAREHTRAPFSELMCAIRTCTQSRWIGSTPLPAKVVKKLEKEKSDIEAARIKKQQDAKVNDLKFDPDDFREFCSSFRKSKLKVTCVCVYEYWCVCVFVCVCVCVCAFVRLCVHV